MTLPDELRRRLHVAHELEPVVRLLADHLATLDAPVSGRAGGPAPDLQAIAHEVGLELAGDDHQLAKVMVALWRGPAIEHRLVAAACCEALGAADLKRLLRFLQKAEKRLPDAASCDALVAGCRTHVHAHPDLFLREAANRLRSTRPRVRTLGAGILLLLARDASESRVEEILSLLHPVMIDAHPDVRNLCVNTLVELLGVDAAQTNAFLDTFADVPAARDTLAAVRATQT